MGKPLTIPQALVRVRRLEGAIRMAKEYLESGEHADAKAFQPVFTRKFKDGEELPPHKDWVKNFYLKQMERRLVQAEKVLWQLEREIIRHQRTSWTANEIPQAANRVVGGVHSHRSFIAFDFL